MSLRMLTSMATKDVLSQLVSTSSLSSLADVRVESAGGVVVAERVRSGDAADIVVLASGAISRLADDGHLVGEVVPLLDSEVVVAVPDGAAPPALGTAADLRDALVRSAGGIGYSTGPSGDGFLALLESWGVRTELEDRLVQSPAGTPVAALVADGRVAIGVQQRSELQGYPGVTVAGALPPEVAIRTTFTGAVLATSDARDQAAEVLHRLASPDLADAVRRHGMEQHPAKEPDMESPS